MRGEAEVGHRQHYSDRACSSNDTFARVSPLLARYGVTRVARQTGLDRLGIPVWSAIRPNSLSLAVNQGKGIDDADARISAVMEAFERAVAGAPQIAAHTASLAGMQAAGRAVDPLNCLIARGKTAIAESDMVCWVEGYDLIGGRPVCVPLEAVMLDRTAEARFWQSSDGLASGNTPLEATFHGLLERIERDAEALWSFAKPGERAGNCVDPSGFNDPVISALATKIHQAGLLLRLFDVTSDIGIPCFSALIGPHDIRQRRNILYAEAANGSGCHPDPVRAAIRAITEAAQSRLALIGGARDDIAEELYARPMPSSLIEDFAIEPVIVKFCRYANNTLSGKLRLTLQALTRQAVTSVVVVPLNPLDAAFSVVKVLVPQLENPPGDRRARFGGRALSRMMRRE
ncbi:MAG: hypothetical protein JWM58_2790 [Rhizobium sp.]|nr:hypothetical protein [Rhizobium sp.]